MTISYKTVEVNVSPDTPTFIYLPIKSPDPATVTLYPFAMGVQHLGVGKFNYPSSQSQTNYFDADGNILPGTVDSSGVVVDDINTTTISNDVNTTWQWGPIHTFYDTRYFDHGYYIKFQPTAGELGRDYQALSMLIADETGIGYSVIDYVIHVLPPVPTVGVAGNLSLAASSPGSADLTLAGTGPLIVSATSSNSALLPDANIGAAGCTAAGHCALTVTPVAGASGDATVTLTVTDAYYRSTTTRFTVRVAASSASGGGGNGSGATTTETFVGGGALSLEGFGLLILFFRRRQPR